MTNFINKWNYKRIVLVLLLLVFVVSLSGCGAEMYEAPLNKFSDETNLFGWLLLWPIGWLMNSIGNLFGGSFGWGLIFTTIIVRSIAWPIYSGANNTMFKMQLAQDDMTRVQMKYAGRTDPQSNQRKQMEMQAIYKKHGINPLGCLALPLQFPIFTAMYTVIKRITVEGGALTLTNHNFLGFDLNGSLYSGELKNQIFNGFLVAIVVGTMILQQKLSQKKPSYAKNIPNKNPQSEAMQKNMKILLIISPVMLGMIATQETGLALYWVIGNTFSLGQFILTRKLQEKNYRKMNSSDFIDPKELRENKKDSKREIIDVVSNENK
ncbi:MAG: YidC/Oxa1 family membrane protein insertase [bacterium]